MDIPISISSIIEDVSLYSSITLHTDFVNKNNFEVFRDVILCKDTKQLENRQNTVILNVIINDGVNDGGDSVGVPKWAADCLNLCLGDVVFLFKLPESECSPAVSTITLLVAAPQLMSIFGSELSTLIRHRITGLHVMLGGLIPLLMRGVVIPLLCTDVSTKDALPSQPLRIDSTTRCVIQLVNPDSATPSSGCLHDNSHIKPNKTSIVDISIHEHSWDSDPDLSLHHVYNNCEEMSGCEVFCRELEQSLQFTTNLNQSNRGILVVGTQGCGKNFLVKKVSSVVHRQTVVLSVARVLASPSELQAEVIKDSFATAKKLSPSVLILDRVDMFDGDVVSGDSLSHSHHTLLRILSDSIQSTIQLSQSKHINVCVVGIARRREMVSARLTTPQCLGITLKVPMLNHKRRSAVLHSLLEAALPDLKPFRTHEVDQLCEDLSHRTAAFTVRDLVRLAHTSLAQWSVWNRTQDSEMNDLHLSSSFEIALENVRPTLPGWMDITPPKLSHFGENLNNDNVSWGFVAGYDSLRTSLENVVVRPLQHPDVFERLGVTTPSGVLLYGPSGCGKTLMVQNLGHLCSSAVLSVRGPELFSKYLGDTEQRIRDLFTKARENSPCLIIFDDVDSIGAKRDLGGDSTGVSQRVLSQLLSEMDGVHSQSGILILGCTSRPHAIDDALLRPGRFEHLFHVTLPDQNDRLAALKLHTHKMTLSQSIDLDAISGQTEGWVGADLNALCREAFLRALRRCGTDEVPILKTDDFDAVVRSKSWSPLSQKLLMGYKNFEKRSSQK